MANFRVDLRDGTTVALMMKEVLEDFNVEGIDVYADNLFVSVEMLRWCKTRKINLCGTTRRQFGFPDELTFEGLTPGQYDWRMTSDGLLAVAWKDVGNTKGMSNFHGPQGTTVLRWQPGQSKRSPRNAPVCMAEYNQFMGGTDLCDQRRGNYTTQRKSKKWWHALFYFTLDVLMVSMHSYKHTHIHTHSPHTHTHRSTRGRSTTGKTGPRCVKKNLSCRCVVPFSRRWDANRKKASTLLAVTKSLMSSHQRRLQRPSLRVSPAKGSKLLRLRVAENISK